MWKNHNKCSCANVHILVCSGIYRYINLARERLSLNTKLKFIYLFILRKTKSNSKYILWIYRNIFSHVFSKRGEKYWDEMYKIVLVFKTIKVIYREKLSPRNKLNFSHSHIFVSWWWKPLIFQNKEVKQLKY